MAARGSVVLRHPRGTVRGTMVDVSEGGVRATVATPVPAVAGSVVDLDLQLGGERFHQSGTLLPDAPGTPPGQVRVEFIAAGPALVAAVRRLVAETGDVSADRPVVGSGHRPQWPVPG